MIYGGMIEIAIYILYTYLYSILYSFIYYVLVSLIMVDHNFKCRSQVRLEKRRYITH